MKILKLLFLLCLVMLTSCSSVRVVSDYDTKVDFTSYKTFAFYKKGIDKASVSDLDKKRIMRAVEAELLAKGFSKSANPDILVSIFTKSREQVNVSDNNIGIGWGWGYNPWFYGRTNININQYTEGTLFIDFIDKNTNELIWQGIGSGAMKMSNIEKKEERINEFVYEIISTYPPGLKK
ncbi:DUF4136 domain-containing protein [Flavobacteriaceae bacterium]|nr:DUF4136 domain-containing protein [Flavobacterium sp.]MDB0061420.1 DUF4136 domain-containing protein [bacterium]MDB2555388.1 DUF4136 domain-containing protein [Flavobacteriaceae bacterium]MDB4236696.1 DUF4136 domain-containing protein [Flavobacteriaceae bacterium]